MFVKIGDEYINSDYIMEAFVAFNKVTEEYDISFYKQDENILRKIRGFTNKEQAQNELDNIMTMINEWGA